MSVLSEIFAALVAFVVGVFVRRYFIFTSGEKKTNLPFIKSYNIIVGSNDIIFANDKILAVNAYDRHQELGDTFGCYFGLNMQIFTRDPDLIYKVCVTEFQKHRNRYNADSLSPYMKASLLEARDSDWQNSRKVIGSVLKSSKLKMDNVETSIDITIGKMLSSIERRIKALKANGEEPIIDVYQINKNFFMQSILTIIFNTDNLVDFDSDWNDVVEEMHKFVTVNYEMIARLCFRIPILTNLVRPFLGFFDHGKYLSLLTTKLEKILTETSSSQRSRSNHHDRSKLTTIHSLINSYNKGELTREQLLGNAVFLMLSGFATSVDITSAFLWHLITHPDVQDKLRTDLLQYGEESKYLEQCINETLRLFPGSLTNRDLSEDVYHKDFRLVKGSCLNISIFAIHRDPKLWGPDAELWRPERFDAANVEKFHPAQFIPFGIGSRNCVGYNLARLEISRFTAQFLLRYKLEICDKTQTKLRFIPLGTLPFALPIYGPIMAKLTPANN